MKIVHKYWYTGKQNNRNETLMLALSNF